MKTTVLVPNYYEVKNGITWVGGPQYTLQKQHIPGYAGYVSGLEAENLHGKTFAKITAETLNERVDKGFDFAPNEELRYDTNYIQEFQEPYLRNCPKLNK